MSARKLLPDLTPGQRFGLWTIVRAVEHKGGPRLYLVRCVCGEERTLRIYDLRSGRSESCGCQKPRKRYPWN